MGQQKEGELKRIFGQLASDPRAPDGVLALSDHLYSDQVSELDKPDPTLDKRSARLLKSGDLVKIFKTIDAGDVQWQGTVKLEWDRNKREYYPGGPQQQAVLGMWVHGLQEGMEPEAWMAMFLDHLPAKIERGGRTYYGSLVPYFETGTEGVIWAIAEYGKQDYNIVSLDGGDKLTVYRTVTDGDIAWQGRLDFIPAKNEDKNYTPIASVPKGVSEKDWRRMIYGHSPAMIVLPKSAP